jgi:hypothetical protein
MPSLAGCVVCDFGWYYVVLGFLHYKELFALARTFHLFSLWLCICVVVVVSC